MDDIKLKPCPFCGEKAVIHTGEGVCVICRECHSQTMSLVDGMSQGKPDGGAVYRVIELWNRRKDEPQEEKEA